MYERWIVYQIDFKFQKELPTIIQENKNQKFTINLLKPTIIELQTGNIIEWTHLILSIKINLQKVKDSIVHAPR